MSIEIDLLTEIRNLLLLMAEPMLEKQHKKFRDGVRRIVGKKKSAGSAILLMDGTRTQAMIAKDARIDAGTLNRLVKALEKESFCIMEGKNPKIVEKLPSDFFERNGGTDE